MRRWMVVCALLALLCLAYLPLLHASKQTAFERGVFPTARMHFPIISLGQEKNRSALDSEDANNHIRIASLARIDPDMDLFLSNPSNFPYVPMAPKIKTNKKERSKFGLITTYSVGKWFHLNGIAVLDGRKRRWRVLSRILFSQAVSTINPITVTFGRSTGSWISPEAMLILCHYMHPAIMVPFVDRKTVGPFTMRMGTFASSSICSTRTQSDSGSFITRLQSIRCH